MKNINNCNLIYLKLVISHEIKIIIGHNFNIDVRYVTPTFNNPLNELLIIIGKKNNQSEFI